MCGYLRALCWRYFFQQMANGEIASDASTDEKMPLLTEEKISEDNVENQRHSGKLDCQRRSFYGLRPRHLSGAALFMHFLLYAIIFRAVFLLPDSGGNI
jgi:hypothetical protein